jgi:zinc protease
VGDADIVEVEAEMLAIIAGVVADGVTEEELTRARNGMLAAAIYARDSVQGAARTFGAALSIGRTIEDVESWPERVEALTVEDINAAARYVFDETQSVTAVLRPKRAE